MSNPVINPADIPIPEDIEDDRQIEGTAPISSTTPSNPDVNAILARLDALEQENATLRATRDNLGNDPARIRGNTSIERSGGFSLLDHETPSLGSTRNDIKINKPETFSGDSRDLQAFLAQVSMYTDLQPRAFASDANKIIFAGSFLREAALGWWVSVYTQFPKPDYLKQWDLFADELERVFGRTDREAEAAEKLFRLKQTGSASEYYTKFLQYKVETGWNEEAQVFAFKKGLKPEVRTALATILDEPDTLPELADIVIRLDRRLYENRKEQRKSDPKEHSEKSSYNSRFKSSNRPVRVPVATTQEVRSTTHRTYETRPHPQLTAEQKQERRDKGQCIICASPDHYARECPKRKTGTPPTTRGIHAITLPRTSGNNMAPQSKTPATGANRTQSS